MLTCATKNWREANKHLSILNRAEDGGYGVIAAIAYNIEQIVGLIRAAEKAQSPLILQFFPWAITFYDGLLVRAAADAASRASVPVSVHLDHCQDADLVKRAADMKTFDSIMVDMSHFERQENLRRTRELVDYCHQRCIATEAEPGRIEGGEDGVVDTAELEGMMTTVEEIEDFIATGVDALAPAFGNIHGTYGRRGPQLDFERLALIRACAGQRVRLVLHGTNGFPPNLLKECIKAGVSKVNVNRLVLENYYTHLSANVSASPHTTLIEQGVKAVIDQTMEWMVVCGSTGKAQARNVGS